MGAEITEKHEIICEFLNFLEDTNRGIYNWENSDDITFAGQKIPRYESYKDILAEFFGENVKK